MNLKFKPMFLKSWTLLEDRIIYGKEEIMLSDIKSINVISKAIGLKNGIIEIWSKGMRYRLVYSPLAKKDGEEAIRYIRDNYGEITSRRHSKDIYSEIMELPCEVRLKEHEIIEKLQDRLGCNEHIHAIATGLEGLKIITLVCTNKRILIFYKKDISNWGRVLDFPLEKVTGVESVINGVCCELSFIVGSERETIKNIEKNAGEFFSNAVNKAR